MTYTCAVGIYNCLFYRLMIIVAGLLPCAEMGATTQANDTLDSKWPVNGTILFYPRKTAAAFLQVDCVNIALIQQYSASVAFDQAGQHLQQGRFTSTIGSDQSDQFISAYMQGSVVNQLLVAEGQ